MKIFLKLIGAFIVMGILASIFSVIIGLLTTVIFENLMLSIRVEGDGLLIIAAVLYQFPVMFIVWIIAQIAALSGARGKRVYEIIFNAIFFTSIAIALLFYKIGWEEDYVRAFFTGMVATISALLAVLLFRQHLKEI